MTRTFLFGIAALACFAFPQGKATSSAAQDDPTNLRVNVVLVQLNVAVTDNKGNYVTGLRPEDFEITEDKISQKISTFEESTAPGGADASNLARPRLPGANVFVLFDTSNYLSLIHI